MKISRLLCVLVFFFAIIAFAEVSFAYHEDPTVFVKSVVDECLYILRIEKNKDIQAEKILDLMKTSFDFSSITESLLKGLKVSDTDRLALTNIFPALLQMRYGIFVKSPDSLLVEYKGHEFFSIWLEATVRTQTKIPNHDMALNYKLHHKDGKWKINDITVGGVSLIDNYRAQIHKTLTRMLFPDFLVYLEEIIGKKTGAVKVK